MRYVIVLCLLFKAYLCFMSNFSDTIGLSVIVIFPGLLHLILGLLSLSRATLN